jgi:hypothetical protein
MNDTMIQAVIWLVAGGAMVLFLKRRRARKTTR